MFEIGKDVCKFSFVRENVAGEYGIRLTIIHYIIIALFFLFAVWTLVLGIQGNRRHTSYAGNNLIERADICDRNGEVLAKDVRSGHIMVRTVAVQDVDAVAQAIHKIIPEYSVNDAVTAINAGRYYFKKYADDKQIEFVKNAKIPGLEIEAVNKRVYPKGRRFSHIVGFVGSDGHGLEGAEKQYDKYLSQNSDPLYLSIDARVQDQFYTQLTIAMDEYQAKAAMGMLMDSRTGEIIAMVSLPDYNPSNVAMDPVANRKFKPMRDILEMGSVFKIFNTAMAYEKGINNKQYYIKEPYKLYNRRGKYIATISDVSSFKPTKPYFSVDEIMIHSCNVGSAQIALDLPDGTQKEFFERLHFNQPLDLEFGRTERPQMPRQWEITEKATVAIGHGISVTPMHAFLAVNAMTNGGFYIYPTLKKREVGRIVGERVLDSEISAKLRDNMRHVASDTSGKSAQSKIAGINIGGKTGTAEKRLPNGKADKSRNVTTFISVFPVEAPQYISLITLDEPHTTKNAYFKTAAWNAVPVTGKILDGIIPLLFE